MQYLVFLLEEPSAREMLKGFLPQILGSEIQVKYIVFEGKQDLEKQLQRKLQAWQQPETAFVVLRDQDSGDCQQIKQSLILKCQQAGKPHTMVRIACRELESWYLGNLAAVEQALELSHLARHQLNRKFRNPDQLHNPAKELIQITSQRYQKVSGSRKIGPFLNSPNQSHSFNVFVAGIKHLLDIQ